MMGSKKNTRRLEFRGTHPKLVTGESYTAFEYAQASGLNYKRLHSKLMRYTYVSDHMLKKYVPPSLTDRLEHSQEVLSDKWLRKPPLSIDKNYRKWR